MSARSHSVATPAVVPVAPAATTAPAFQVPDLGSNADQIAQLQTNPVMRACDSVLDLVGLSCSGMFGGGSQGASQATPQVSAPAVRQAPPAPVVDPDAGRFTPLNSQRPGSPQATRPPADLSALTKAGYTVYPMASADVLYAGAKQKPDAPLSQQKQGPGGYDAVLSGTFTTDYVQSAGPIVRDGKMDTQGHAKAVGRGGMAILQDGTIVVGRADGRTSEEVQSTFGSASNPVRDFMGGGALLVEGGKAVSDQDLRQRQLFDQGGGGIHAQQMRSTHHVLVGIRDGQAYALVAHDKSGAAMQRDLTGQGFDAVVKYDGGSGGYVKDGAAGSPEYRGKNSTGLGIRTRK